LVRVAVPLIEYSSIYLLYLNGYKNILLSFTITTIRDLFIPYGIQRTMLADAGQRDEYI
jgi:hypothetical protein